MPITTQEVFTMTRYDERYDEFGYEREDYDGTVQLNEYLTPKRGHGTASYWEKYILQNGAVRSTPRLPCWKTMAGKAGSA